MFLQDRPRAPPPAKLWDSVCSMCPCHKRLGFPWFLFKLQWLWPKQIILMCSFIFCLLWDRVSWSSGWSWTPDLSVLAFQVRGKRREPPLWLTQLFMLRDHELQGMEEDKDRPDRPYFHKASNPLTKTKIKAETLVWECEERKRKAGL